VIIFAALLPGYILSIFYRSFLSVIAGPVMTDLAIGPREFGLIGSAWFFAFALAQFPVGWALDRIGPRRTVMACMVVGTAGALLFATASHVAFSIVAMGMVGIGCSPVFMSALYLFARSTDQAGFAVLASLFIGVGSFGNLAGAAPLAWAAEHYGWRPSMLMVAGLFALATLFAAVLVRDPPPVDKVPTGQEGLLQGLASIMAIRPLWLIAPITLSSYAILATVRGLWIGPYMTTVHVLDGVASGEAAFVMAVAMTVGAFAYGALEKALGQPKLLVAGGTVLTALSFAALAAFGHQSVLAATVLFAFMGFAGFTYALLMAHARMFFPGHLIGRGMTFVNFLFIAGAAIAQSASGWFIAAGQKAGFEPAATFASLHWIFGGVLLVSTMIYLLAPATAAAPGQIRS
jgi:predicted MFS family arabinose efflux permease